MLVQFSVDTLFSATKGGTDIPPYPIRQQEREREREMASVEPSASPDAAAAQGVNTWFFMCGPLAVNVFIFGLAWNLHVFKKHEFAIDKVLDMRRDEIPTAKGVALFACLLTGIQMTIFGAEAVRRGVTFGVDEVRMELLLLLYCTCGAMLMLCPFDIMHLKCRLFVLRKIGRCLWPFQYFSLQLPAHPTPFIEVFLADGLTSLSKFIQDSAVALLLLSVSFTQETDDLRSSYITKMKQSPLPYFAASAPYMYVFENAVLGMLGSPRECAIHSFLFCWYVYSQ